MVEALSPSEDQLVNLVNHNAWPFAPAITGSYLHDSYGMRWTKKAGLMVPDLNDGATVGAIQAYLARRGYLRSVDYSRDGVRVMSTSGKLYIEPNLGLALTTMLERVLNGSTV